MIEKLFLDTNVVLDLILGREGNDDVKKIVAYACQDGSRRLYVSYLTMANIAFVLRKAGPDFVRGALKDMMGFCNVLSSNDMQILSAMKNGSPDFEDALQIACAESRSCDVILTRNVSHFIEFTEIPVITPVEFVSRTRCWVP